MNNKPLALDEIALVVARHLKGDASATRYLQQHQVDLMVSEEGEESNAPQSSKQKKPVSPGVGSAKSRGDFAFPILTVNRRSQLKDKANPPEFSVRPFTEADDAPNENSIISKPAIEDWTALLSRLANGLRKTSAQGRVNVRELVEDTAKLKVVNPLPLLPKSTMPNHLLVYLDDSQATNGLHNDMLSLVPQLKRQFANCNIDIIILPEGASGNWYFLDQEEQQEGALALPAKTEPALIVTNIDRNTGYQWRFLISELQQNNSPICWLSLTSPSFINARHQDKQYRYQQNYLPGVVVSWGQQELPTDGSHLGIICALLTTTRVVTGAMLRELIQYFHLPSRSETAFWQEPDFTYYQGSDTGWRNQISNTKSQRYLDILHTMQPEKLEYCSGIIERHLAAISQSVLHEHRMHLSFLSPWQHPELNQSQQFFDSIGSTIQQQGALVRDVVEFLADTMHQYGDRVEMANANVRHLLALAGAYLAKHCQYTDIPPSLAEQVQQLLQDDNEPVEWVHFYQKGHEILPVAESELRDSETLPQVIKNSVLLGKVKHQMSSPILLKKNRENQKKPTQKAKPLALNQPIPLSQVTDFVLQSQFEALSVSKRSSKDFYWAKQLSVTSQGVMAQAQEFALFWRSDISESEVSSASDLKFLGNYSLAIHHEDGYQILIKESAPKWLSKTPPQLDQYGIFVELTCKDIPFQLRYIPSGSFLMGSPEHELQRVEDRELQHMVKITKGYWLGETAVTQKLWKVVMGYNSSEFQGKEELPVERISWVECVRFANNLGSLLGGINFNLPTEAQWEFACRAGTKTPFNVGDSLSVRQANFVGKGKLYGVNTVDVNYFEPNAWGLKQMHGNVWEWCLDDWEYYKGELQVDPVGVGNFHVKVFRGGSWFSSVDRCRSASRARDRADYQVGNIGLRISVSTLVDKNIG
ncbi:formylglycine-generating enzyme family protein [Paraneptunicella aestuarii]|uniref:formylglycine-generating enzyme family protein n=1 Tax=Paraneptunicella aestuarii TaxID=2831148 RepID=UPI001E452FB1|nr:formylglycine-generating enzyme family protein [Paraneptunicella aestuarii]UAA39527.1 formylglycine-generating enzyme family protein [Paraneptunicella aestuarii]